MINKFTVRLSILTILFCSTHFQKIEAAEIGNLDAVKRLCERNANVNTKDEDGWTALMWTLAKGYTDVVRFLAERGCS